MLKVALGTQYKADGSCRLTSNAGQVLVGIYGPADVHPKQEQADAATLIVSYRLPFVLPSPELSDIEAFVRGTFSEAILRSLHPRTQIEITIQVLEDDGAILATAINATTLALVNAGVPMRAMVVACSAAFVPVTATASPFSAAAAKPSEPESLLVLNPTLEQRAKARAFFTIAFDSSLRDILATRCSGSFSEHELVQTIESCRDRCSEILSFIRQTLDSAE